jgi:type I restriction enzyme S subunit
VKKNWATKKIGEVCTLSQGLAINVKTKHLLVEKSDLPLLRIKDLKNNTVEQFVDLENYPEKCLVTESDLIYTRTGQIGLVFTGRYGILHNNCFKIVPDKTLLREYLFWFLQEDEFKDRIIQLASRTAQPDITHRIFKDQTIPVPPIAEQKQIVAILDEAFEGIDSAIANTERNLTNAREIFESYLNAIFTRKGNDWVEKKLDEICSIKHGFAFKGEFFTNEETDYVVLTPGSFYESGGYRDQGPKTKYYTGGIPEDYILNESDFLFAMTEQAVGLLGSSLIVPESDRFLHNQRLGLVQVFEYVPWHNDFFFHQFNTRRFRDAVQDTASGVKVRHTSPKKLGAIPVCFPPTVLQQKQVADKLNALHAETQRLEAIYQQKLAALNELKQSILQKAFSGKLTAEVGDRAVEGLGAMEAA